MASFCSAGHILLENSLKKVARLFLILIYISKWSRPVNLRNVKTRSVDSLQQYTGKLIMYWGALLCDVGSMTSCMESECDLMAAVLRSNVATIKAKTVKEQCIYVGI